MYLPESADRADVSRALAGIDGVEAVHSRDDAANRFALPADRIGDLVVGTPARLHNYAAFWIATTGVSGALDRA